MPALSQGDCKNWGFSLIEALLALTILSLVVVSFLGFLTDINVIVKVQGDLTEASEDLRYSVSSIVKQIRMAGAGGLPLVSPRADGGFLPLAIDVVDGATQGEELVSSAGGGVWLFESSRPPKNGTDVLRIRGVMTSPTFGIAATDFEREGRCAVSSVSPWTGHGQALTFPGQSLGRPFIFALQAPLTIPSENGLHRDVAQWRVVEICDEAAVENAGGSARLHLKFDDSASNAYVGLNAARAFEVKPKEVFSGGFLDDFVFLVSNNGFGSDSLYRLRVTRGGGARIRAEEMVPNVVDFQVALGCDLDANGRVAGEEWFLSRDRNSGPTGRQMAQLNQIRLSIVTRTQQPDQRWSKLPDRQENGPQLTGGDQGYRYRSMTVRITPRIADVGVGASIGPIEKWGSQ